MLHPGRNRATPACRRAHCAAGHRSPPYHQKITLPASCTAVTRGPPWGILHRALACLFCLGVDASIGERLTGGEHRVGALHDVIALIPDHGHRGPVLYALRLTHTSDEESPAAAVRMATTTGLVCVGSGTVGGQFIRWKGISTKNRPPYPPVLFSH